MFARKDLRRNLEKIIEKLKSQINDFPTNCCAQAAIEVHKHLGLDIKAGFLKGEKHAWNYDAEDDAYIDITAGQYDLPSILILDRAEATHLYGYIPVPEIRKSIFTLISDIKEVAMIEELTSLFVARPF